MTSVTVEMGLQIGERPSPEKGDERFVESDPTVITVDELFFAFFFDFSSLSGIWIFRIS